MRKQFADASDNAKQLSNEVAQTRSDLSAAQDKLNQQAAAAQQRSEQLTALRDAASTQLQDAIADGAVVVEAQPNGVLLRIGGSVLFGAGQSRIRRAALATLDKIADFLEANPDYGVRVDGHTDSIPPGSGSRWASNWELATARASAAVRHLESKGIDPNRLYAGGYAEFQPLADNDTREGRAQNRRIEIVVAPPQ